MCVCVVQGSLARCVDSRAIVTTASRRQRHRSREARRLSDGRIDAIDAAARRVDSLTATSIDATRDSRHLVKVGRRIKPPP